DLHDARCEMQDARCEMQDPVSRISYLVSCISSSVPRLVSGKRLHEVVDARRPARVETLAELDADERAMRSRARLDDVEEVALRKDRLGLCGPGVVELALEGPHRGAPRLDVGRDVHDEVGLPRIECREVDR